MTTLNTKQLNAIEKSMKGIIAGDEAKTAEITDAFTKFRKALGEGAAVTADDVDNMLADVMIEKTGDTAPAPSGDAPTDPIAPILHALYNAVAPIAKKAGSTEAEIQEMFQKAYAATLGELDSAINEAVEATAVELGQAGAVEFGKKSHKNHKNEDGAEDPDCDGGDDTEEDEDMSKILKKYGVPDVIAKRMESLQTEVAVLTHDKNMAIFNKRAAEVGAPEMASDLLKLHETDPELCLRVEKRLAAQSALLRKSAGWSSEIGSGRDVTAEGVDGPLSQLNGLAKEMVSKGLKGANGKTLSFAKAFSIACDQNPDVYAEYQRQSAKAR